VGLFSKKKVSKQVDK